MVQSNYYVATAFRSWTVVVRRTRHLAWLQLAPYGCSVEVAGVVADVVQRLHSSGAMNMAQPELR